MKIQVQKCSCGLMQNPPNSRREWSQPEELTSILETELEQRHAKLEAALDQALNSSPVVRSIIREIHEQDCEVVLVLTARAISGRHQTSNALTRSRIGVQLELTSGDKSFLRSLRIASD